MSHRTAVMNQLLEWQNRIDTSCRGIEPQILETEPVNEGWPPSLVLSHLADWLDYVLTSARAAVAGETTNQTIENTQEFNEAGAVRARERSWTENSHRLHNQVELAAGFLSEIRDANWDLDMTFPCGRSGTIAQLFEETLQHHIEHGTRLQQWREERDE